MRCYMWPWNLVSKIQFGEFVQTHDWAHSIWSPLQVRSGCECSKIWELAKIRWILVHKHKFENLSNHDVLPILSLQSDFPPQNSDWAGSNRKKGGKNVEGIKRMLFGTIRIGSGWLRVRAVAEGKLATRPATHLMAPTMDLGLSMRVSMFELRETGDWDLFPWNGQGQRLVEMTNGC